MAQNSPKHPISVGFDHFFYYTGLDVLVWGFFWTYMWPVHLWTFLRCRFTQFEPHFMVHGDDHGHEMRSWTQVHFMNREAEMVGCQLRITLWFLFPFGHRPKRVYLFPTDFSKRDHHICMTVYSSVHLFVHLYVGPSSVGPFLSIPLRLTGRVTLWGRRLTTPFQNPFRLGHQGSNDHQFLSFLNLAQHFRPACVHILFWFWYRVNLSCEKSTQLLWHLMYRRMPWSGRPC
jgi:hypothetical protein